MVTYLVFINIFAFLLFGLDKYRAKKHLWRIPEKVLLITSFLGGSLGALFAMIMFLHKTKHLKFIILVPLFLVLNIVCTLILLHFLLSGFQNLDLF
ncbi:MAG: DUF1294 domain-containing protein [Bacteroidales bacterium]|nr:DUF1294 domain-containing protein [Candidatus Scybalousia scybalohippi]